MIFRIKTDALFEAKDIDDAFLELGKYFTQLGTDSDDADPLFLLGNIEIKPEQV